MKKRQWIWFLLILIFPGISLMAGDAGFLFLRSEMGGRPAGMGGAFAAVTGDLQGVLYNPASIVSVQNHSVIFHYTDHLIDISQGWVAYSQRLPGMGQIAVSLAYMNYGEIEGIDENGLETGTFIPGDFVAAVTYGDSLVHSLYYGGTVKIIQSRIEDYTSAGIGVDFGIIYRITGQDLNIGMAVSNLGRAIDGFMDVKEPLPLTARLGLAKQLAHLPLFINLNLIQYFNNRSSTTRGFYWAAGGEFSFSENLFLRFGYNSRGQEEKVATSQDRFAGASIGFGLQFQRFRLDYALCQHGVLGSMNHIGLTTYF